MANEWTKVELYGANNDGTPRRFTIADGTAVSQGAVMALSDPRTVIAAAADTYEFAGIASMDKEANDGSTSISCWTDGVFEAVASDAILLGMGVTGLCVDNQIIQVQGDSPTVSQAHILGHALEAADAAETINVRLRL